MLSVGDGLGLDGEQDLTERCPDSLADAWGFQCQVNHVQKNMVFLASIETKLYFCFLSPWLLNHLP